MNYKLLGNSCNSAHNGSEGFKDNLTQGGQGAGVYGHVLGQGGARVVGIVGQVAGVPAAIYDKLQEYFEETQERTAEVNGNSAGWHMWNFMSGATPREPQRLRNSLMSELCK